MSIKTYIDFFENITKDTPINEYKKVFDESILFIDPFHEVIGIEKVYMIFQKMFSDLQTASFEVIDYAQKDKSVYIRWVFNFKFKNSDCLDHFEGMSHVIFNDDLKAVKHKDYWDAASNVYEKLPLIKQLLKYIKNKIKG